MARTKVPAEFSSTPGIVDNSSATAITIDSAGAATFSGTINGLNLAPSASGNRWGITAEVASNGVMEVGRYIDFHSTDADTSDYGARLDYDGSNLIIVSNTVTTGSGTFNGNIVGPSLQVTGNAIVATTNSFEAYVAASVVYTGAVNRSSGNYLDAINTAYSHKWYTGTTTTGGTTEKMRIDSSGNVGIGTNTPVTKLDVKGTFGAPDTTGSAGGFISRFAQSSGGGVLDVGFGDPYSWIQSRNSADYATQYGLSLNPNGGNVGIGVLAPPVKLTIDAPAADRETIRLATYYSPIDNLARGGISWHDGGAVTGQIDTRYTGTTVDMHLGHLYNLGYNTTSRVIIKGNGNVEIPDGNLSFAAGHGIDFSATANAGGTSNATGSELLDDYEEGTWYPYLGTETQLGGASGGNSNNRYVKIGRFVHCTGWFSSWDYANVTSGTYMMIRNLPFPPEMHSTGLRVSYASNIGGSTYGYGHTSLSAFYLLIGGSNGSPAHYGRAAAPTSGTAHAMLNITYYTDS